MIGGLCNAPDLDSCRTANILHPDHSEINGTSNPKVPIMMETLTLLADGTALMAGGIDDFSGTITNSAEIFTPPNEFFIMLTAPMMEARAGHTATLLNDGTVLIAGGIVNIERRHDRDGLGRDLQSRHANLQSGARADDMGANRAYGDVAEGRQGAAGGRLQRDLGLQP